MKGGSDVNILNDALPLRVEDLFSVYIVNSLGGGRIKPIKKTF